MLSWIYALAAAAAVEDPQPKYTVGYLPVGHEVMIDQAGYARRPVAPGAAIFAAPVVRAMVAQIDRPLGSFFPGLTGNNADARELRFIERVSFIERVNRGLSAPSIASALACTGKRQDQSTLYKPRYIVAMGSMVEDDSTYCLADRDEDGHFEAAVMLDRHDTLSERPISPVPYRLLRRIPYSKDAAMIINFIGLRQKKGQARFKLSYRGIAEENRTWVVQWRNATSGGEISREFGIRLVAGRPTPFQLMGLKFVIEEVRPNGTLLMSADTSQAGRLYYRAVGCQDANIQPYWCEASND